MMAKSYAEKQKWAATLEAISSCNTNSTKIKDIKVFGNIVCRLSTVGNNHLDILCSWPINNEVCQDVVMLVQHNKCGNA